LWLADIENGHTPTGPSLRMAPVVIQTPKQENGPREERPDRLLHN